MSSKQIIYMNNAATTFPKPLCVIEAVKEAIESPILSIRSSGFGKDYIQSARLAVSDLFNINSPLNIIFTSNATESLNIIIGGLVQKYPDCHALVTAFDHNSVLRPVCEYHRQNRLKFDVIPIKNGNIDLEDIKRAITSDTKFMVMSHGSNVTGTILPIISTGNLLHKHKIFFVVDGAQTAGEIPIDLSNTPIDCYVFTGHKGLFGAAGIGGFYIRDPLSIPSVKYGGTGTNSLSPFQPEEMPERFEAGTHNYVGLASLTAGIEFVQSVGVENIANKAKRQTQFIIKELSKLDNIRIYNYEPELPVVAFNIIGMDNDDVGFILAHGYNIIVRCGIHCAPLVHKEIDFGSGSVRLSLSWFTTDEECSFVVNAITEIANGNIPQLSEKSSFLI